MYSLNFKVLGLKLLHPVILYLTPISLTYRFSSLSIITEDYLISTVDLIYYYILVLTDIRTLTYYSIITFIQINAGLITFLLSLKLSIAVTTIVGNIIYIYLSSLIVILISLLLHLILSGLSLISYLLYLSLTRVEFFLYILFSLESFSNLFQSSTLANRSSINSIAGSLLTFSSSNSSFLSILLYHIYYSFIIFILSLLVYCFEIFNCFIQLLIYSILSLNIITLI